ncbi:MAG: ATP-dependent Clp protease, protease subunit [Actinomycetota bacterium]|nr:ATP-dependent Clp protease, protease subunit [Actinomycetota bacterium]
MRVCQFHHGPWLARSGRQATLDPMPNQPLPAATDQFIAGDRASDIYQRLLRERIVFLGTPVDDTQANLICAQLLLLAADDAERDIALYINSPGGSVTAGLAIYDTMQYVSCDVATICVGLAASMGQFLLCAGEPGKRYALPHSRILMHQPSGQMQGQAADIAIQAEQIIYLKRMMAERIAFHTGQPIERIEADSDRDRWFTAEEAKDYGFIDRVIERASAAEIAP